MSKTVMKTPTAKLTANTMSVRLRVCWMVGQDDLLQLGPRLVDEAAEPPEQAKDAVHDRSFFPVSVVGEVAGAAGLEPTTAGFGDQSSAN